MTTDILDTLRHTRVGERIEAARAERAARRQLQHDLAAYTTPSDLAELYALIERYPEADTAPIREYLNTRPVGADGHGHLEQAGGLRVAA